MSPKNEDFIPENYMYEWTASSDVQLPDFLMKYKPSMVQNDGTKPWIWVRGADSPGGIKGMEEAAKEASAILDEASQRVEEIKNDDSIPMRSSKKTGSKSKKELREQTQAEATEKLKDTSERHGYVNGKWLIFAPADRVDIIWSSIATSLTSGPLKDTSAYCTKVSTSPENDTPNYQHVICVYMPNVYDKDAVTKVMKVLLRNHGVNLSGVKSDLYTMIGLDSKHGSGIPSTVWKNTALLKDSEIKELKEAYFSELSAKKAAASEAKSPEVAGSSKPQASAEPKKKVLKKKVQDDDPFASDEDANGNDTATKKPPSKKKPASTRKRPQEDESEEEAKPKKGRRK